MKGLLHFVGLHCCPTGSVCDVENGTCRNEANSKVCV